MSKSSSERPEPKTREQRLAEALRANLRRRKAAGAAEAGEAPAGDPSPDAAESAGFQPESAPRRP